MKTINLKHKAHKKTMFLKSIWPVVLILCNNSFAHDVTVNISGAILDNTCTVSPSSAQKDVVLGNIASKSFHRVGDASFPVRFTIDLQDCGEGTTGVVVTLKGDADAENIQLLQLSGTGDSNASGIGIAIQDDMHTAIAINDSSKSYAIDAGAKNVSLVFYAQYMSSRTIVTPGVANATATFELAYP